MAQSGFWWSHDARDSAAGGVGVQRFAVCWTACKVHVAFGVLGSWRVGAGCVVGCGAGPVLAIAGGQPVDDCRDIAGGGSAGAAVCRAAWSRRRAGKGLQLHSDRRGADCLELAAGGFAQCHHRFFAISPADGLAG